MTIEPGKKEENATIVQDQSATANPLQDAFQKAQSDKQKPATAPGVLVEVNKVTTPQGINPVGRQGSSLCSDALHPDNTRFPWQRPRGILIINVIVEVASIAATKGEHPKYAERTIKGFLTNSKQIKEISVDAIELND
jgi:hypothetical protein